MTTTLRKTRTRARTSPAALARMSARALRTLPARDVSALLRDAQDARNAAEAAYIVSRAPMGMQRAFAAYERALRAAQAAIWYAGGHTPATAKLWQRAHDGDAAALESLLTAAIDRHAA